MRPADPPCPPRDGQLRADPELAHEQETRRHGEGDDGGRHGGDGGGGGCHRVIGGIPESCESLNNTNPPNSLVRGPLNHSGSALCTSATSKLAN